MGRFTQTCTLRKSTEHPAGSSVLAGVRIAIWNWPCAARLNVSTVAKACHMPLNRGVLNAATSQPPLPEPNVPQRLVRVMLSDVTVVFCYDGKPGGQLVPRVGGHCQRPRCGPRSAGTRALEQEEVSRKQRAAGQRDAISYVTVVK